MNRITRFSIAAVVSWACLQNTFQQAHANVYATSIRFNGSSTNISSHKGSTVAIGYILNEGATAGVRIEISGATNLVRTITLDPEQTGTARGSNTVAWDGTDGVGNLLPEGTYSVRITAASAGHADWTLLSEDNPETTYVYHGTGIAVNQNPLSPRYGQVYIANSDNGPNAGLPGARPGENNGILRFNADGSAPAEGILVPDSTWSGSRQSPWRLEVTPDDYLYASDLAYQGEVYRWPSSLDPDLRLHVLRAENLPGGSPSLTGFALNGASNQRSLWVADSVIDAGAILRYDLDSSGAAKSGDHGTLIITNDPAGLDKAPYDVALDAKANIYSIQSSAVSGDVSPRVFRFASYDPSTNSGLPKVDPDWAIGQSDDTMGRASGIAVDPTGTYVAVAFLGINEPDFGLNWTNGCTQIFYASNGVLVTNLDLGVAVNGEFYHQDTDCAWDTVGNVYFIDDYTQVWRVFSPPGTNQASTQALQTIQIIPGLPQTQPVIQSISVSNGFAIIRFAATPGTDISQFKLVGAPSPLGPLSEVSGAVFLAGSDAGHFIATAPASGSSMFYRIQVGSGNPGNAPEILDLDFEGQNIVITFSAPSGTALTAFAILGSVTATGPYVQIPGVVFAQGASSGLYTATFSATTNYHFFRVQMATGGAAAVLSRPRALPLN